MKKTTLLLALLPCLALAGKTERDFLNKEVLPAIQQAESSFKTACGCALKINVQQATLPSKSDLYQAKYIVEKVKAGAPKYCTDDASKKALCKMSTLEIAKAKKAEFTLTGSKGLATTNGQSSASWDMMTAELDK